MNEITITLTGLAASEYMTKESKLVEEASAILEENSNLHLKILELETYIATMKNEVPDYFMKDTPDLRLKRDSELMKDSQYEKKSPFKRPEPVAKEVTEPTLDETWRAFVDAGEPAINTPKTHWSEADSAVIENAIDKTDIKYYSVGALARFLNRSIAAVRTRAITNYGAHIRNGMIVSEV